jgi:hypothetical protein
MQFSRNSQSAEVPDFWPSFLSTVFKGINHHTTHIKVHYMTDPFHTSRFVLGRELLPA